MLHQGIRRGGRDLPTRGRLHELVDVPAAEPNGYLLGSYRIATAPEVTRFDSPANNVGPWPANPSNQASLLSPPAAEQLITTGQGNYLCGQHHNGLASVESSAPL